MIISPPAPAHHYIPGLQLPPLPTVIFHAVFFAGAGAGLHICTVPVQYVKEANICSVQSVISIYLFSLLGELLFFSGA